MSAFGTPQGAPIDFGPPAGGAGGGGAPQLISFDFTDGPNLGLFRITGQGPSQATIVGKNFDAGSTVSLQPQPGQAAPATPIGISVASLTPATSSSAGEIILDIDDPVAANEGLLALVVTNSAGLQGMLLFGIFATPPNGDGGV